MPAISEIIEAWETNTLPDDLEELFEMKKEVWACGRLAKEACGYTSEVSVNEMLIQEQIILAEIHEGIGIRMKEVALTLVGSCTIRYAKIRESDGATASALVRSQNLIRQSSL
jgi:hypothetical protein